MKTAHSNPQGNSISQERTRHVSGREKRFRRRLQIYVAALLGAGAMSIVPSHAAAQDERQLSALDGTNGFRLDGVAASDRSGVSVSGAGDVNGDGFADFIVGALNADPNGNFDSGAGYVVFGKASGFLPSMDLSALTGADGFRLAGAAAFDRSGRGVSGAGDVNGDGFDDLIVGAYGAGPNGNSNSGASYVVFGKASGFLPSMDLTALNGADGFRLAGVAAADQSGFSVSGAGDVNGDGFADLIIGARYADPNGNSSSGASHVVFGKASGFAASLNLSALTGADGFRLAGAATFDQSGRSVSGAGDVNGDGFADLIIGAPNANSNGNTYSGASYVVFGKADWSGTPSLNLSALTGADGFRLAGAAAYDNSGNSVSGAGDVNGDGFADLIVGAQRADPNGFSSGASYVVFGKASGFAASVNLSALNGADGFGLAGVATNDQSGVSASGAGDVNGDGFADLIIGARFADPNGNLNSGTSYVVFGKASGFATSVNLSALTVADGFHLAGAAADDLSGYSVSGAGDVNGDGFADLIISAHYADPNGNSYSGASYVVFGNGSTTGSATYLAHSRPGNAPPSMPGIVGDGSDHPNAARARIDFSGGTTTSQETVTLFRATSGTVTGIANEDTADAVWQITTDRAAFTTAAVTLTYLDSEIARVTDVAGEAESSLTMYKSETPAGPWIPLPTTIDTAKNEATATVTAFSYFLLGAPPASSIGLWDLYEPASSFERQPRGTSW